MISLSYYIKLYFIKLLKRTGFLSKFNFHFCKKINNKKVKINFINGIGLSNFILKKSWIDSIIAQFAKSKNGVFIDIGANIGQTLLSLKTQMPEMEYVGFEPNSICVHYVNELVRINKFEKCRVYNIALSIGVEKLELEKVYVDDPKASVISELRPGLFSSKDFVFSVDYDSYFVDLKPVFIKIDVEGAELEVLKGMKRSIEKHNPMIVCEVLDSHDNSVMEFTQKRANYVVDFLKSLNYSVIQLETCKITSKLLSFKKIESIEITQWTIKSYNLNDYLFYPSRSDEKVISILDKIIYK